MVYENNFKVVNDRMIVDPTLAVFVRMGRMHFEEEGWQVLHISHDPEMTPSVLTRIAEWESADADNKSEIRFPEVSKKSFSFFEFTLRKITEGEALVLEFMGRDEEYYKDNLGSIQRGNLYECADRKAFLLYVFRNILLLPKLQECGFGKCTKVQLRMSAVKFALLEGRPTEELSGDVILDERDLAACRDRNDFSADSIQ
tara:strand:- start:19546 stop:20145 length:600 start_codon:yes stop_codon:yes gene_type:complete